MKKIILTSILVICLVAAYAQLSIDYRPKALLKALRESGLTDLSAIKEFVTSDSGYAHQPITGKFFQLENHGKCEYKYIYIGRVNSCRAGGCSIQQDELNTSGSEYFDYYILYDPNKTVRAIKVFNYQATHGHEITAQSWLRQFIGHERSVSLQVDKNIDGIAGATISVFAITFDVEQKTKLLSLLK